MPRIAPVLLAALWLGACTATAPAPAGPGTPGAPAARVTGTLTWPARGPLSPDARIRVQLVDVSLADAPARVLGEQRITTAGRPVPFAFAVAYDPADILPHHTYAVQARVEENGALRFINDRRFAVITQGAPTHVDMDLIAVGGR
jgi:putative lipoprotein